MGGAFFTSWTLWVKMTFVMGCAIVLTIALGGCKVVYDRWRIRKYQKVAEDKGKTPQMIEAGPPATDEIPFGIRAIQSGIEVDGIWISNPNTPAPSSPASPASSIFNETGSSNAQARSMANSDIQPLSLPPAARDPHVRRSPSPSSRDLPSPGKDLVSQQNPNPENSLDRTSRLLMDRPPSDFSTPNTSTAWQRRSNVHSMPRESVLRDSSTLGALEGIGTSTLDIPQLTNIPYLPPISDSSSASRQNSSSDDHSDKRPSFIKASFTDTILETHPGLIRYEPVGVPRRHFDPRTNLDLLQSHRLSHVAETGQLTPRTRRPGFSGEWASVALLPEVDEGNSSNSSVPRRSSRTPSPPSPVIPATYQPTNLITQDPFATPSTTPRMSPTESYPIDETIRGEPRRAHSPQTYRPTLPHQNSAEDLTRPRPAFQRDSQAQPQILRKVNSGFEILVPGTFRDSPMPPTEESLDPERSEKRQSRKLQKKKRPESDFRASGIHNGVRPPLPQDEGRPF